MGFGKKKGADGCVSHMSGGGGNAVRKDSIAAKALALLLAAACVCALAGCGGSPVSGGAGSGSTSAAQPPEEQAAIPVKVLILPHFEVGEMSGDYPGEAQYFAVGKVVIQAILDGELRL